MPKDLATMDTQALSEEGVWFTPVDYEGEPIEYEFCIYGSDSKVARAAASERTAKLLEMAYEKKKGKDKKTDIDLAEAAAGLMKGWRAKETGAEMITWKGRELTFSKDAAVELFRAVPFLADQVDRYAADRRHFTRPALQS